MNILIIKTSAIGDVTHTLPSLLALRKRYPGAKITWLLESAASDIVVGHRAVDRVLISHRKKWFKQLKGADRKTAIEEIKNFIKTLRDTQYDLAIDFQGLFRSGIMMALARAKRKVGFGPGMEHSELSWLFYNQRIPAVNMDNHAIKRSLMLLEQLGVPCRQVEYDFPVGKIEREIIKRLLQKYGISDEHKLAAINPIAMWETKLWEKERFAEIADRLITIGYRVVFTGSGNDRDEIEKITALTKSPVVNLAGQTTLKTLGALFEKAAVVLTTDTGPMHIAAAVQTPVVAIFGPTAPWRTGPFGKNHRVVRAGMDCSPCFKRTCPTRQCMKDITVKRVWEAIVTS